MLSDAVGRFMAEYCGTLPNHRLRDSGNTKIMLKQRRQNVPNRQKLTALLIMCFTFAAVENNFAEQLKKDTWSLGPEISYFTYEEPHFMKDKGFLFGITGSYTYHDNLMLKAEGRYSFGNLDYSSPGSGTMSGIPDYIWEFRGLAGYDFVVQKGSILTPYIGIGYRYLNDDSSGKISSAGDYGYERESNYYYSPIGVKVITNLHDGWSTEATAEYDIFWSGKQISHLSDADPGYNDPENRQKHGYGIRGSIEFQKKAEDRDFALEPFIRYWSIKESQRADWKYYGVIVGEVFEPKNHSTEYGINLLVKF